MCAESRLVHLPDGISDELAAAILLKGMTAQYLIRRIHPVKAGETIVFHAAAGGVGQIGCQWAQHLGATVIGSTTSPEKVELAKANGCAHVINTRDAGWEKQVRELTGGKGVPVVYDSIGKDTFMAGLDCLAAARHHGHLWQCLGPGRSVLARRCWRPRARCSSPGRSWRITPARQAKLAGRRR